jgi:transcriptional regulator with XRE-family HTH domain
MKILRSERSDTLYETIKELAKKRGMSISSLEASAGIARGTIAKWKVSSPTISSLEKVANVLELEVSTLIQRSKKK